jgi:creatinine amidohydrolase
MDSTSASVLEARATANLAALPYAAVRAGVLAVPLGATEQHGPHLPLGTDTTIARALAAGLAGARRDVVVAPALPFGSSGEHAGFAGTLSIGRDALELVLVELARSAAFPRVLFVCAHGGNAEPLAAAVRTLRAEGREARAWAPRWAAAERAAGASPPVDAHAGRTETSLMLGLAPELVGGVREAGNPAPLAELMPRLRAEGVQAVSANGVLGDPAGASAAEGRALLVAAVADLVAFVDSWAAAA